jgi:hypothetical protein
MDIKALNKLAKACRKLGIAHLKTGDIEIAFASDIMPLRVTKRKSLAPVNESIFNEPDINTQQRNAARELSETDLLFWSSESAQ